MSRLEHELTCDALTCAATPSFVCACPRCNSETTANEKFHSCTAHRVEVEDRHFNIRGDMPMWRKLHEPAEPADPRVMPAAELFARARATLDGKSRSYVEDAKLFARAIMLLERLVAAGHIEIEVERE